ncbi:hypothetical protein [Streptomyces roseolus]|uniref:hypothetical protein n=1 Tax=Streptomyces roseolus TaxID=67358 RepID=UPI00365E20EE
MTCQTCGRPAEGDVPTHWLGCGELESRTTPTRRFQESVSADTCEHEGCSKPKKDWSGRGARPKFCAAGHK